MTSLLSAPSAFSILVPLLDDVPEAKDVTPGWIYAVVIIGLFVVTFLLWLSMRKQLGKIRFPEDDASNSVKQPDERGPER